MDKFVTREVKYRISSFEKINFQILSIQVHRLIIVDDNQHIIGILSMSDLMRFLVSTFESKKRSKTVVFFFELFTESQ